MIGLGVSAIGDVSGRLRPEHQEAARSTIQRSIRGRLPVERGYHLSPDDQIRRYVITQIMCNFHLEKRAVADRFGIDFDQYFGPELEKLAAPGGPREHGFLTLSPQALHLEPLGQLFVRNVAMVFDLYLRRKGGDKPIFSRTV